MQHMPPWPVTLPKPRRPRKKRSLPPAQRSARLYVTIDPSKVHLFKYLLEAEDNLALMTVVDRWRAALMVRFSPHQENAVREHLEWMRKTVSFAGPVDMAQPGKELPKKP